MIFEHMCQWSERKCFHIADNPSMLKAEWICRDVLVIALTAPSMRCPLRKIYLARSCRELASKSGFDQKSEKVMFSRR